MQEKVAKSEKLNLVIARAVRDRIKQRNQEIQEALDESGRLMEQDSIESDNEEDISSKMEAF